MYTYKYPRAALTVDAIVYSITGSEIRILLIQRGKEPFKDKWALPGGFVDMDETLENACRRELKEETGLEVAELTQFKAFDKVDRDPRGRTISIVFYTKIEKITEVRGNDDAAKAEWFKVSDMSSLAFDHKEIIEDFIKGFL